MKIEGILAIYVTDGRIPPPSPLGFLGLRGFFVFIRRKKVLEGRCGLGLPQEVRILNMEVSEIYKQCYVKWEPKNMYLSVFNMVIPVVKKSQEGYKIKRI